MRAIHIASAALLGAGAALALAAPAAVAGDAGERGTASFGSDVSPTTVAAGDDVTLSVWGCETEAKVFSAVFNPVVIPKGQHSATVTVGWGAEPGKQKVTFQCGAESSNKDLTIEAGQPDHDQSPTYTHNGQQVQNQRPTYTQYGVQAGAGGTFAGFDVGDIGLGLALVAGSVGAAYHWSHRRTAEDHN
ncbi:hypothetical protein [Streptomyces ureilyticus]|uniref:Sortase n=1 Tax=Streptomyces ureilyticus TaxID=1775131 RepID=A0ABX0E485_9ACTN|nr:hypothetical protein [Streptomyces ureilyticus]NGO48059.1 hypothetical protein [Streptomyces ureilyticus]